jgi:hypothetical protein
MTLCIQSRCIEKRIHQKVVVGEAEAVALQTQRMAHKYLGNQY